jgi:predicted ATPase
VVADGVAEITEVEFPASLRLAVLRRLGFLSEETLDVLRTASVLGSAFSAADLATVLGRPSGDLVPVLTDALQAGVVTGAGPRFAFRHDVVHEAIYQDLPAALRRALHVDAGKALAAAGAPARRVATHLALGAS